MLKGVLLFLTSVLLVCVPNYRQIETRKGFQITLEAKEEAKLSRDGSYARTVKNTEWIEKPGIYFLTTKKNDGTYTIQNFQIPYEDVGDTFQIQNEEVLEETLKLILTNYQEQATLQFNDGTYTFDEIFQRIDEQMKYLVKSYPRLYYNRYHVSGYSGKNPIITLEISYTPTTVEPLKIRDKQITDRVNQQLEEILTPGMTDFQRQLHLIDYLVEHTTYAKDTTQILHHTLQGTLVDGVAVCDGYARSLMYLLNSCGIPTTMIYGTADGVPHAWNLVEIQGNTYHVDVTWADQDGNQIGKLYDYINETSEEMRKTHQWDDLLDEQNEAITYTLVYAYPEGEGVYRINNQQEWLQKISELSTNKEKDHTLIFMDQDKNKWNEDDILNQIIQKERAGITYMLKEKYNTLVVHYRVKD